ncbi:MAG: beta-propeller fold lactonase family protein [Verrucomicrobiota bacterium]
MESIGYPDLDILEVVATIPVGAGPHNLLLSLDGTRLLILNLFSRTVSVIDVPSRNVIATLEVGRYPSSIALDPSGLTRNAYLTIAGGDHELDVIDPQVPLITTRIPLPPTSFLNDLWISPNGLYGYLADSGSGRVQVLDLMRQSVQSSVFVGSRPFDIEATADPNLLLVSCFGSDSVALFHRETQSVQAQIPVGRGPFRAATNPQTGIAYVLCSGDQTVAAVDPIGQRVTAVLPTPGLTGPSPRGDLAFDRNGTRLLVSAYQLSQIHVFGTDPAESGDVYHQLIQSINVPSGPIDIRVTPDGQRILVVCPNIGSLVVLTAVRAPTMESLAEELNAANIPANIKGELSASLNAAIASFDRGNQTAGVNQLQAFQNKVLAQAGKKIDQATANALIAAAQRIIDATGSQ